jgi:hypothetical protein
VISETEQPFFTISQANLNCSSVSFPIADEVYQFYGVEVRQAFVPLIV